MNTQKKEKKKKKGKAKGRAYQCPPPFIITAGNRHKQNSWFCKEIPVLVEESSRRRFARYVHVKN